MCNELGGGRRRLYSDATGVGRTGSHKEQQTHSGDSISWFNDYEMHGLGLQHKPVTTGDYITNPHKSWGAGMICPNRTLISVRIIVPTLRRASSPISLTLQLILEQYMVELHSPPGRYTIIWYLAEYVNTLMLLWFILEYNTNPFWFSHIYTRKVLLPHIIHYHHDPIYPRCVIRHLLDSGLLYITLE